MTKSTVRSERIMFAIALCLVGLAVLAAAMGGPAEAQTAYRVYRPTPAPIAGVGLIAVGVAGAALYAAIRRYRKPD